MSGKLIGAALIALSVSNLEAQLAAHEFTADELAEAIELEKAGDNRKTAIEALEATQSELLATELADDAEPELPPYTVAEGKSLTTKRGILANGQEITAKDLAGGQACLDLLVKKSFVDKN